jgi:hypothetical protein
MRTLQGLLAITLALVVAIPLIATPATAGAQSAGDEQYVDPFQNGAGGGQGNDGNSGSGGERDGGGGLAESGSAPAGTGDTAGSAGRTSSEPADSAASVADDGSALPNTGLPLAGVVCAGVLLLTGGAALRRRA